jgi:transcriptional regulator with XRE-family HTH domain
VTSLRDLRIAAGLTQLELGVLGGLSQPEIALVESGKRGWPKTISTRSNDA